MIRTSDIPVSVHRSSAALFGPADLELPFAMALVGLRATRAEEVAVPGAWARTAPDQAAERRRRVSARRSRAAAVRG